MATIHWTPQYCSTATPCREGGAGGQVEVVVGMQKRSYLVLTSHKTGEGVSQVRLRTRDDTQRRSDSCFHGRLDHAHEEPAYPSRNRLAAAQPSMLPGANGRSPHRGEIGAVSDPQMVEALGHAPRTGLGAPSCVSFTEPGNERLRITLCGVEFVFEFLDIRRQTQTQPPILKYEKATNQPTTLYPL